MLFKALILFAFVGLHRQCESVTLPPRNTEGGIKGYFINLLEDKFLGLKQFSDEIENDLKEITGHTGKSQYNDKVEEVSRYLQGENGRCAENSLKLLQDVSFEKDCPNVDELVQKAGEIIQNTTEIITGTIHSIYLIFNTEDCGKMNAFRCFLQKFHEGEKTVFDVIDKVVNYKAYAENVIDMFRDYFKNCLHKGTQKLDNIKEEHKFCKKINSSSLS